MREQEEHSIDCIGASSCLSCELIEGRVSTSYENSYNDKVRVIDVLVRGYVAARRLMYIWQSQDRNSGKVDATEITIFALLGLSQIEHLFRNTRTH